MNTDFYDYLKIEFRDILQNLFLIRVYLCSSVDNFS